mmetsp:Transcript_36287/g.58243  ORF Transcript_36287/g.58243 Transcript_36287/m.58243 type:complete len:265 (+) Transcript_36287:232-1026(+)
MRHEAVQHVAINHHILEIVHGCFIQHIDKLSELHQKQVIVDMDQCHIGELGAQRLHIGNVQTLQIIGLFAEHELHVQHEQLQTLEAIQSEPLPSTSCSRPCLLLILLAIVHHDLGGNGCRKLAQLLERVIKVGIQVIVGRLYDFGALLFDHFGVAQIVDGLHHHLQAVDAMPFMAALFVQCALHKLLHNERQNVVVRRVAGKQSGRFLDARTLFAQNRNHLAVFVGRVFAVNLRLTRNLNHRLQEAPTSQILHQFASQLTDLCI